MICESFCSWKLVGKSKNAHKVRREFRCQVPECGNTNVVDSEYDREVSWTDPARRIGFAREVQTTIHELLDRNQDILESNVAVDASEGASGAVLTDREQAAGTSDVAKGQSAATFVPDPNELRILFA